MAEIVYIHPDKIHPNPDNPRYEAGDVTSLAKSIGNESLLQPLLVINAPEFGVGHVMIEDGYRRWVAGKKMGLPMACTVREVAPNESLRARSIMTALITDLHKEHLTAMERAVAYGKLRDEFHMSQRAIAQKLGFNDATVGRYLKLLELSPRSQEDVRSGKLTVERAVKAVTDHRAKNRAKAGKKPVEMGWEPDHFTDKHHLAKRAKRTCDAREHTSRRRLGGIACGQCWEDAIRQDQTTVLQAAYIEAQREGTAPIFVPPFLAADNGARPGVTGNAP